MAGRPAVICLDCLGFSVNLHTDSLTLRDKYMLHGPVIIWQSDHSPVTLPSRCTLFCLGYCKDCCFVFELLPHLRRSDGPPLEGWVPAQGVTWGHNVDGPDCRVSYKDFHSLPGLEAGVLPQLVNLFRVAMTLPWPAGRKGSGSELNLTCYS